MKNKNILGFITGTLLFIITAILVIFLKKLNILPDKYFIFVTVGLFFITIVIDIFLFIKRKGGIFSFFKVLAYIAAIILFVVYSYGIHYLNKTMNFFGNMGLIKEEITSYYVIVLKDSKYEEISDLYGQTLTYSENIEEEVLSKIKLNLKYSTVKTIDSLKERLYTSKTESILVSDVIKEDLEEKYIDFSSKTRILTTIDITKEVEDITKKVSIKNTPFNVLISGIDTYGSINKTSRNDVNIIVSINPNTNKVLLTSIPRDYYVQLHGKSGYKDKLTHAGIYGINVAVQTIEDLLDIDINYYVKVNFTTVVDLVDKIGPINVYSDQNLNLWGCKFIKGYNSVDGDCALAFARERHSYVDGDRHRGRNQQEVIRAIFNKVTSGTTLISEYTEILDSLDGKFATNMDMDEVMSFVKYELDDLRKYNILDTQLDGVGSMELTYSYPHQKLYVMIPDEESISDAKEYINKILSEN